jgi:osmotically-inducible protein OsmY
MGKTMRLLRDVMLASSLSLAAACTPTPERPAAGTYVDDSVITSRVLAALKTEVPEGNDIRVDTSQGVVNLSGFAWDRQTADRAEAAARKVAGVIAVKNEIVLRGGRKSF